MGQWLQRRNAVFLGRGRQKVDRAVRLQFDGMNRNVNLPAHLEDFVLDVNRRLPLYVVRMEGNKRDSVIALDPAHRIDVMPLGTGNPGVVFLVANPGSRVAYRPIIRLRLGKRGTRDCLLTGDRIFDLAVAQNVGHAREGSVKLSLDGRALRATPTGLL